MAPLFPSNSMPRRPPRLYLKFLGVISTVQVPTEPFFPACPFSSYFVQIVPVLDLDVLYYPCPRNGPNFRAKGPQMGGKQQFPYMKVVKDSSRDSNGVRRNALVLSGSKRPSSESFRSSDDRRFSNAKRMRVGVSARSYGYDSRLDDSKDLRLKLTRKRMVILF
ncbi:hypothetical protein MIMGU_mgv1a015261mg [Erythranthe guttata]|uniref:Uncharacterized protein n=1 Tax=Erythranthe guttata TaxID=4155 RepID=A0A022PUZ7_ERYGU|nr:hypothetical protein MIMGU_mgv1a015261mg [Erythranthe guttata]